MTRDKYFKSALDLYVRGEIDETVYDAIAMNADQFCEDDEEEEQER